MIVLYQGESVPLEYIKPLLDLPPAARNTGTTDLPGLAPVAGFSATDFASQHGKAWLRFPAAMKKYDIPALRRVYNIFQSLPPHLAANSSMITEGYSVHGVQSVPKDSTAYPDRENNLLLSPFIVYDPDPAVDDKARAAGKQMQSILAEASGSGLCSYVNYAFGDEGTEAWYGREEWRLEKLRKLKHLWDPERKFGWYCPID